MKNWAAGILIGDDAPFSFMCRRNGLEFSIENFEKKKSFAKKKISETLRKSVESIASSRTLRTSLSSECSVILAHPCAAKKTLHQFNPHLIVFPGRCAASSAIII